MRSTRELVLLIFAATGCAVLILTVGGLLTIELAHPEVDTTAGLSAAWDVTALMFGAVAGYVLARRNGNGKGH